MGTGKRKKDEGKGVHLQYLIGGISSASKDSMDSISVGRAQAVISKEPEKTQTENQNIF